MRVAPCRVADLIANVIQTIRETYPKEEEVLIRVKGLDELPPILGDESQLSTVFHNLIRLAVGGHSPRCSLIVSGHTDMEGRAVLINVTNTDYCMPSDVLERIQQRIMDPDSTLKTTEEIPPKRGGPLSLPICKLGVQAHGGKITVDSAESRGTTWEVRLPIETPQSLAQWKFH